MKIPFRQHREKLLAWYRAHSPREQQMIVLLAAVIVFAVIYKGMWQPVERGFDEARRAYGEERDLLQWMQARAPGAKQIPEAHTATNAPHLSATLLTDTTKKNGIAIKHLETGQDGHVSLTFEAVPFNQLISWFDALENGQHMTVFSVAITKTNAPGLVNTTLQVKGQGD
jgi:general secretion pathway protein M